MPDQEHADVLRIPGRFHSYKVKGRVNIENVFKKLKLDVTDCVFQKNGSPAQKRWLVRPGDTIFAMTKIHNYAKRKSSKRRKRMRK